MIITVGPSIKIDSAAKMSKTASMHQSIDKTPTMRI